MISLTSTNTVCSSSKLSQRNKFLHKRGRGGGGCALPTEPPSKSAEIQCFISSNFFFSTQMVSIVIINSSSDKNNIKDQGCFICFTIIFQVSKRSPEV